MSKKWFRVIVPVTRAIGEQQYLVEADTAEDAVRQVEAGEVPVSEEFLEVETVTDSEEWETEEIECHDRPDL